jgi:hypothetical protein
MTPSKTWNLISPRNRLLIGVAAVAGAGIAGAAIVKAGDNDRRATIPAGTMIVGALQQTVSTKNSEPGTVVVITTTAPLKLGENTIPSGMQLRGEVTYAKGGGRIAGAPELTVRFTRLDVDGNRYEVAAEPFRVKGTSDAKESAIEIAGGTVAGAVVGKVTGSVVRGAVVGAAIGTGVAVLTKGDQIVLPAGQRLRVRLSEPVTVKYSTEDKDA